MLFDSAQVVAAVSDTDEDLDDQNCIVNILWDARWRWLSWPPIFCLLWWWEIGWDKHWNSLMTNTNTISLVQFIEDMEFLVVRLPPATGPLETFNFREAQTFERIQRLWNCYSRLKCFLWGFTLGACNKKSKMIMNLSSSQLCSQPNICKTAVLLVGSRFHIDRFFSHAVDSRFVKEYWVGLTQ